MNPFYVTAPLLIVSLLQLFVLWGMRLSIERIEKKLTGADGTLSSGPTRRPGVKSDAPPAP